MAVGAEGDAIISNVGTDHVWVAIDRAVSAAFDDKAVLEDPPKTQDAWMWLSATVADHGCAAMRKELYRGWQDPAKPSS